MYTFKKTTLIMKHTEASAIMHLEGFPKKGHQIQSGGQGKYPICHQNVFIMQLLASNDALSFVPLNNLLPPPKKNSYIVWP
jgi:hypothetical protein